jgi:hypothetical protein
LTEECTRPAADVEKVPHRRCEIVDDAIESAIVPEPLNTPAFSIHVVVITGRHIGVQFRIEVLIDRAALTGRC